MVIANARKKKGEKQGGGSRANKFQTLRQFFGLICFSNLLKVADVGSWGEREEEREGKKGGRRKRKLCRWGRHAKRAVPIGDFIALQITLNGRGGERGGTWVPVATKMAHLLAGLEGGEEERRKKGGRRNLRPFFCDSF